MSNSASTLSYRTASELGEHAPIGEPLSPGGPVWGGLTLATWIKIGVLGLLLLLLYWVNLARIWAKTNPIYGEGNWEHAVVIPIIGLYYLYVWRDELTGIAPPSRQKPRGWGLMSVVWLFDLCFAAILLPVVLLRDSFPAGIAVRAGIVGVALVGINLVAGIAAVAIRTRLSEPETVRRLDSIRTAIRLWLMAQLMLQGVLFFIGVVLPGDLWSRLLLSRVACAALVSVALVLMIWAGRDERWRVRFDRLLGSSSLWFGGFVMVWGVLFSFWGIWPGQNDFFKDVGMVISLFGVVLLVAGWGVMRIAWFPIIFLFCALPWPATTYSWVALPLQNFAAKVGVFVLNLTGVQTTQFGTKIVMTGHGGEQRTLNVAEACAGLKSLMTFISVAAAVAFLSTRSLRQKVSIVAAAVPIAILCNAARVSGQGLLDYYVSKQWSENFAHGFAGLVMLIPGFFLILGVCWVIDHLFVEHLDDEAILKRLNAKKASGTAAMSKAPATSPRKQIIVPRRPAATSATVKTATKATGNPAVRPQNGEARS